MTDRPINLSADQSRRIRAGEIVQMRRPRGMFAACVAGDRLWIREPFYFQPQHDAFAPLQAVAQGATPFFAATGSPWEEWSGAKPRPGRTLPKAVHRAHLVLTDVRDQQLQDITDEDAVACGARDRAQFATMWDAIIRAGAFDVGNPKALWAGNQPVTALTFTFIGSPL